MDMKEDINVDLFKRTNVSKKIDMVSKLSIKELLNITEDTILKIIKKVGSKRGNSREYSFIFSETKGNNWNSEVEGIIYSKRKLKINLYLQLDHTDTNVIVLLSDFLKPGNFTYEYKHSELRGNDIFSCTSYFSYNEKYKSEVIRELCLEYLNRISK